VAPSTTPQPLANEALKPADAPPPTAEWSQITWFAALQDGYSEYGSFENLGDEANTALGTHEVPPRRTSTTNSCANVQLAVPKPSSSAR
jgi:hypothetical protein